MTDLKVNPAGSPSSPVVIEAKPVLTPESSLEALELQNRLRIRSEICHFLIRVLGCSTAACFGLIVLQGFHPWGFQMDPLLLKSIVGATVIQSGTLLAVFVNGVWQKGTKRRSTSTHRG